MQKNNEYSIDLNVVRLDYLTITSYRDEIYQASLELAQKFETHERKSLGNYEGWYIKLPSTGTAFVGWGSQRNMAHNLIQLHGNTAHVAASWVAQNYLYPDDRCGRMDVQATVEEPDGWNQFDLLARLNKSGRLVNYRASKSGATVYIGSMESERFCRVYQKFQDGKKLLRLEVEMSGKRSNEYIRHIGKYAAGEVSSLSGELLRFAQMDKELELVFASCLVGANRPVKIRAGDRKTDEWMTRVVIPAIAKYCNEHDSDPMIVERLQRATRLR